MDTIETIARRRSVRRFLDKRIDGYIIKEIIRIGTLAPTACNRQAWRFIIITDKGLVSDIKKRGGSSIISRAPVGILVLYNKFTTNLEYPDNIQSVAACIQNMLLAATYFGLGACWINALPPKSYFYKFFKIPKRYDIVAYIALGYPAYDPEDVPRKYTTIDELISYNRFEMKKEIEKRKLSRLSLRFILILIGFSKILKGIYEITYFIIYSISPNFLKRILIRVEKKIKEMYIPKLRHIFKVDHKF